MFNVETNCVTVPHVTVYHRIHVTHFKAIIMVPHLLHVILTICIILSAEKILILFLGKRTGSKRGTGSGTRTRIIWINSGYWEWKCWEFCCLEFLTLLGLCLGLLWNFLNFWFSKFRKNFHKNHFQKLLLFLLLFYLLSQHTSVITIRSRDTRNHGI